MVARIRNQFVMSPSFRPMLAAKIKDMSKLEYPLLATPKIDGIRCVTREKMVVDLFSNVTVEPVTRYLNPIPNAYVRRILGEYDLTGLDGELITYTGSSMDKYNDTQSKILSQDGEPDFIFHVFDLVEPKPYWDRMAWLKDQMIFPKESKLRKVLPVLIMDETHLLAYEAACLQQGFEGVMLRHPDGPYKFGRSTFNQHWLLKLKRFQDAEATIIGFEEKLTNTNEPTINALGLTERSSHQANLIQAGTLGALVCTGYNGIKFNIGTGFDDALRQEIWNNKEKYLFTKVKYKYQPHGSKEAPRCPVFLGFRSELDMDNTTEN